MIPKYTLVNWIKEIVCAWARLLWAHLEIDSVGPEYGLEICIFLTTQGDFDWSGLSIRIPETPSYPFQPG